MNVATRIIEKCGGIAKTAELTGRTEASVYKWTYPKDRGGTGGTVPQSAQLEILKAAKLNIVDVSPADFFPEAESEAAQ